MGDNQWMNCPGCDEALHPSNERGMWTAGEPARVCPHCGLVSWVDVDDTGDDPYAYVTDDGECRDPDPSTYSEAALRGLLDPEGCDEEAYEAACDAGLLDRGWYEPGEQTTPRGFRLLAKAQAVADGPFEGRYRRIASGLAEASPWERLVSALYERGRNA